MAACERWFIHGLGILIRGQRCRVPSRDLPQESPNQSTREDPNRLSNLHTPGRPPLGSRVPREAALAPDVPLDEWLKYSWRIDKLIGSTSASCFLNDRGIAFWRRHPKTRISGEAPARCWRLVATYEIFYKTWRVSCCELSRNFRAGINSAKIPATINNRLCGATNPVQLHAEIVGP